MRLKELFTALALGTAANVACFGGSCALPAHDGASVAESRKEEISSPAHTIGSFLLGELIFTGAAASLIMHPRREI